MLNELNFTHLTPSQFEHLCFDLLHALGAEAVNWRKGSPTESSPSDQGRDIECTFSFAGPVGERLTERRFVECKHHSKGVPPRELEGALAWATAERPDTLCFMVSGFLSNPAKEYLEAYKRNTRPVFRITVWERPQIAEHLGRASRLLRKYGLAGAAPHLDILHPAHVRYLSDPKVFGLREVFAVLDKLPANERDELLGAVLTEVIHPAMRQPVTGHEFLVDLMEGPIDYPTFRRKCNALDISEIFLGQSIVDFSLRMHFLIADLTRIAERRDRLQQMIAFGERKLREGTDRPRSLQSFLRHTSEALETLQENTERNYRRYEAFCEKVLLPILETPERSGESLKDWPMPRDAEID